MEMKGLKLFGTAPVLCRTSGVRLLVTRDSVFSLLFGLVEPGCRDGSTCPTSSRSHVPDSVLTTLVLSERYVSLFLSNAGIVPSTVVTESGTDTLLRWKVSRRKVSKLGSVQDMTAAGAGLGSTLRLSWCCISTTLGTVGGEAESSPSDMSSSDSSTW